MGKRVLSLGWAAGAGHQPCWGRTELAVGSRTRSCVNVRRHAPSPALIGKVNPGRLQLFQLI